jgi:hypothetical protein
MKKFFFAMSILALSALLSTSVEAKGKSGPSGGGSKGGSASGSKGSHADKGKAPHGKSFQGKDGKSYQYTHCPSYLQHFSKHYDCRHWNHYCWYGSYGCCGYYCPIECAWYYWYEPFYCYLPCRYLETYRPVEAAPVSQVVNVNTNTNVNTNASAPAGPPAFPTGASAVPAGFTPPLPGKQ